MDNRHVSGNYGLLDLQIALCWVAQDVRAFGGDPGNITVMGESAGANAVLGLLASPASEGLFQSAIVQSSTDGAHTVPLARADRETYATETRWRGKASFSSPCNYRLGLLGFLALPQLDAESLDHVSGNYGLLDMAPPCAGSRPTSRASAATLGTSRSSGSQPAPWASAR